MMRPRALMVAGAVAAVAMVAGPVAGPAGASRRSGHETIRATVYEGFVNGQPSGTGPVTADGVLDGHGVNVELPPAPTDSPDVNRVALVFRNGTLIGLSTNNAVGVPRVDRDCNFSFRLTGTTDIVGGTGAFAHASGHFTDVLRIEGVLPRNPDGSCNTNESTPPVFDIVHVDARGQLSL